MLLLPGEFCPEKVKENHIMVLLIEGEKGDTLGILFQSRPNGVTSLVFWMVWGNSMRANRSCETA